MGSFKGRKGLLMIKARKRCGHRGRKVMSQRGMFVLNLAYRARKLRGRTHVGKGNRWGKGIF